VKSESLGLEVDEVCRKYGELQQRLKTGTLEEAVDFFNSHGQRVRHGATMESVYAEYLQHLTKRGVGIYHLRDVKRYVGTFVDTFPGLISAIQTPEMDSYFARLGGSARNKNNHRKGVIAFYNFAQEKGFLPHGILHAAATTTDFRDARSQITSEQQAIDLLQPFDIYSPEELRKILAVEDEPLLRPTLEIKAFSGVRTEEIVRLWWVMVAEPEGCLKVPDAVGKICARRVPLLPNLQTRLADYPAESKRERVSVDWPTANSLTRAWRRVVEKAGVQYKRNAFRNSYITYRLILTDDIAKVAEETGTSPRMIKKNYQSRAAISRDTAEEWFAGGAIAGNTTMLHLLVNEDPTPLGIAPFTPRFIAGRKISAASINLVADGLAPETPIQLLPGIAAYIGADITAGVFASGMVFDPTPSLLVDIGTNGEIVLQSGGKLTACATAAGPAFEGCGLRCGTRAREGAVSDLWLTLDPFQLKTETIGNVPLARANGLCGSAYVDFLATARSCGLLTTTGRFELAAWESVPAQNRFTEDDERALRLTEPNGNGALRVSEVDIALLLQAKAAIGAGIEILLETAGIRAADLGRVYLAGGFGMHLNVAHAIAIGLLPGFREEQMRVVGNTSLAGALLALVDRTTLEEMENLRPQMEVIELNLAADFEDRYIEHLLLP
jgi:integrase